MHFLYTDEANIDPKDTEFFIYAGVAVPGEAAKPLSDELEKIRSEHSYKPGDLLKFNTVERPDHVSQDAHREAKRLLVEAAGRHGVKLLASFILHNVATSPDEARRNEINRICYHFDCFLARENDHGLVLIDPFTDSLGQAVNHLREKFSVGLVGMPYSKTMKLARILGYHLAPIGTSHFCSLVDVVIGSLRFAVNNRNNVGRPQEVAKVLVQQLAPLCITDSADRADELSIFFSPKTIEWPAYLETYRELHGFLAEAGIVAAQEPSDRRFY